MVILKYEKSTETGGPKIKTNKIARTQTGLETISAERLKAQKRDLVHVQDESPIMQLHPTYPW